MVDFSLLFLEFFINVFERPNINRKMAVDFPFFKKHVFYLAKVRDQKRTDSKDMSAIFPV